MLMKNLTGRILAHISWGSFARTPEPGGDPRYFSSLYDSICCEENVYCQTSRYSIQTGYRDSSFNFKSGLCLIKQFEKSAPVSTHGVPRMPHPVGWSHKRRGLEDLAFSA